MAATGRDRQPVAGTGWPGKCGSGKLMANHRVNPASQCEGSGADIDAGVAVSEPVLSSGKGRSQSVHIWLRAV
jgi:hypothetical protein